jgi:hypothetical protein
MIRRHGPYPVLARRPPGQVRRETVSNSPEPCRATVCGQMGRFPALIRTKMQTRRSSFRWLRTCVNNRTIARIYLCSYESAAVRLRSPVVLPCCDDGSMTTGPRTARPWTPPTEDEFTSERAVQTLQAACAIAGLDSRGARLLRLGTNANYRLAARPVMVRIAPGHIEDVRKEVDVARWLAASRPRVLSRLKT